VALAAVVVPFFLRVLIDPLIGDRAPFGLCLLATIFVAWRYGLGPALVTLGGGVVLARYFFEHPRWSFAVPTAADQARLIVSVLLGALVALVCESLRVAARFHARLAQQAREDAARKDEFLATLSHELRNPLAPIRMALYQLDHIDSNDPRAAPLRKTIAGQVEHLVRLVNDLLDVSRITRGKIQMRFERVSLKTVVDAALDLVRPLVGEKEHDLQVTLPPQAVYLFADPVRLTQVLANLLNNAAKYTDNRGRIWLTAETGAGRVVIRVHDTGIGIAPQMQGRIFDLFQQGHPSIEKSRGGLGVGLTLARDLVEMHGGTLEVASPGLGRGSEFTVRLPVAAELTEPLPAAPPEDALPAVHAPLRILVVDDSVTVATTLADVLRFWNYTVEVSYDAFSALDTAARFRPDVVLADLGLPRMNGYQLAVELRRLPGLQHVSLIAVSGYGQPSDREQSKAAGFARHLVKPVDPAELQRVLGGLGPSPRPDTEVAG
jgi:signal transduction histidine kinase/CheY-like chemotaxis protein